MATETSERKATKSSAPPPEAEHLPCPRCDSTNTKFCYYNNYNFSQPRHFCKACRRYWTHGGTLRDIPIGGGTRKNAKRCRTFSPSTTTTSHDFHHLTPAASQLMLPLTATHGASMPFLSDAKMGGSFTSLLNSSPAGNGVLAFGVGIDDVGFGLGRVAWPFSGGVEGGNTWQLENGEAAFLGAGDYFAFPDLAISTPRTVLK